MLKSINKAKKIFPSYLIFILIPLNLFYSGSYAQTIPQKIVVSPNKRFLQYETGTPFLWQGDTAWHLFNKLTREEAKQYLRNRAVKGFNVIQCMVIPHLPLTNIYGDSAFINSNPLEPLVTSGNNYEDTDQYDYWDHINFIIDEAARNNIYVALVPIWGSVVKSSKFTVTQMEKYAGWLASMMKCKANIFWINGGDIRGDIKPEIWTAMGNTLRKTDPSHLITFHPFGRTQSSTWFHNAEWLDFNMFQSGHRAYDQRKGDGAESWKGEDNWRYVLEDLALRPQKPTLDGEPSYENIPKGLHDTTQPYWQAGDCRRYMYWSLFAGSLGHTYGDNAVMQFYKPADTKPAYGAKNFWYEAIDDSGSFQICYATKLLLSRPFFERVYDSTLVINQGTRYNFIITARGNDYLFAYTYTGREFKIKMGRISGSKVKAWWYNPRNGIAQLIGTIKNSGINLFTPPGKEENGNDWVLVLDDTSKKFPIPGAANLSDNKSCRIE